jgi:GR25 family glycosyltransferase involved in LPS biosynthesis
MFDIRKVKKIVINLERRPDRLKLFKDEMDFIGWEYDIFKAIDYGSYLGCAYSHLKILEDFLATDEKYIMIFEDDCYFMPYVKEQLEKSLFELSEVDWDYFHLGPSINCPVNNFSNHLLNLSELPKQEEHHRGIYNTVCYIINRKFAQMAITWNEKNQKAIDQYYYEDIFKELKCFAPSLPLVTQRVGFSDINKTTDNNHYLITYNWNLYTKNKLDIQYYDINYCENLKYS